MATILAANTGNWSATSTWTGGVVPVAGDIVVANGKTITMDTLNVTVAELRNDTTGGAVAGGRFNLVNGSNVVANVYAGNTSVDPCVSWASGSGQTATITGQFFGGTNSQNAVTCTGSGNLVCGGGSVATGGSGSGATSSGVGFASSGTFTFGTPESPGIIIGGTSTNSSGRGIICDGANATIVVYASLIRGTTVGAGRGLHFTGANQQVTIVATDIGATNAVATSLDISGSGTHNYTISGTIFTGQTTSTNGIACNTGGNLVNITIAGNPTTSLGSSYVIHNSSTSTINVIGNFGGAGGANAFFMNGSGTINITGTVTALTAAGSNTGYVTNNGGTVRITRVKGNGYGPGSIGINANNFAVATNTQTSLTYIEELEFGPLGSIPIYGQSIRLTSAINNKAIFTTTTGSIKTLVDSTATAGVLPSVSDVRNGVVFNAGNNTGTCFVPAANSVALGVPVDNTTGTAVLTAANVRTAIGMASANLDAQLDALPTANENATAVRAELNTELTRVNNCATVATTGQQIQDALI